MGKYTNILWICFGNTARSALAFGISKILKKGIYKEQLKNINFDSAGFFNIFKTAQPEVIDYLKEKGLDMSDFRGKILDEDLLKKQDLILAMEIRHLKRLRRKFKNLPEIHKKAFLMLEFAGETENLEIDDPVNKKPEEIQELLERVEKGVVKSIKKIIQLNKETDLR